TLPTGLSLSTAGVISGTPTASGNFVITATVSDSSGQSLSRQLSLLVKAPPLSISTASLPDGVITTPYSQTITTAGAVAPVPLSLVAGACQAGLALPTAGTSVAHGQRLEPARSP